MMGIDVATGLPELPEDHRWRVKHPRLMNAWTLLHSPLDLSKLVVVLERRHTVTETTGATTRWFRRPIVETRYEWKHVLYEPCAGTAPIAVLNAARRIMKQHAKREAASALVGTYPPMKLEVAS